ncbi:MerR family transcriptional regulator [Neobacillus vireti]|uniref:MerR family transcriptional regulator n=1 Tax=Neobacillus vireti TaxID=220686 RepID=UPI002FFE6A28
MSDQEGKYNIKAAALMLGIQPGTLRAWERRYQMIAPVRNEAGHRLYTDEHIKILKWLIKKVNQGFTISQAISLMGHNPSQMDTDAINLKTLNPLASQIDSLYDALIHFEHHKINEVMNTMFSIFTMEKVIIDIFSQVFLKIEDSFKNGYIISAQRNFSSRHLSARINTVIHSLPNDIHLNKALCITSSKDGEAINLLLFSYFLRKQGIDVINIGTYHSEEDIKKVMEMIHPDILIISCEDSKDLYEALTLTNLLSLNYQDLAIGLCGHAISTMNSAEKEQFSTYILGQTKKDWEMWLLERLEY